ncbi:MAG: hypothetical protein R3C11_04115 [Planctomycetaceae bacterium]
MTSPLTQSLIISHAGSDDGNNPSQPRHRWNLTQGLVLLILVFSLQLTGFSPALFAQDEAQPEQPQNTPAEEDNDTPTEPNQENQQQNNEETGLPSS